jgi:hypothetical protein
MCSHEQISVTHIVTVIKPITYQKIKLSFWFWEGDSDNIAIVDSN